MYELAQKHALFVTSHLMNWASYVHSVFFSETEADSCQYYKDHLSATLDGFYNIFTRDTEIKKRVFCKGITDDQPIVEYPYEELGTVSFIFFHRLIYTASCYKTQLRSYDL